MSIPPIGPSTELPNGVLANTQAANSPISPPLPPMVTARALRALADRLNEGRPENAAARAFVLRQRLLNDNQERNSEDSS